MNGEHLFSVAEFDVMGSRPIITQNLAATCWQPQVKGLTVMVNSIYNG